MAHASAQKMSAAHHRKNTLERKYFSLGLFDRGYRNGPVVVVPVPPFSGIRVFPASGAHRLVIGLFRVATGNVLVPSRMECPGPRLLDRAASHGLKGPGLADGAEVDVNEDSA